jgi:hypothetical protein
MVALLVCSGLILSYEWAYAFPVSPLPDGNLLVNPWFRSASDPDLAGFDGWTLLLTDGVTWGPSQKESNPSPDIVVSGRCGHQSVYCGTAARWAQQAGVYYPNIDVFAYQVVAADPANRHFKFFAHYVSHRVDIGAVNIYGGDSPDGPWELVWVPLYHTEDDLIRPESGSTRDLWTDTGIVERIVSEGLPYYKIELQSRLPELRNDMIFGGGFKITGIYFTAEFTDQPGEELPPRDTAAAPTPAATAGSEATTPEASPDTESIARATEVAEAPSDAESGLTLSAEALSATEIALTLFNTPNQGRLLRLERSLDGATGWQRVTGLDPSAVEYIDSGLNPDAVYYYRVRVSRDGISNVVSARTQPLAEPSLTAPALLQVQSNSPQEAQLSWVDESENETGFVIERSLDGLNFSTISTVGQNVTSYTDANLGPATYFYRVRSFRDDAHSDFSEIVTATIGGTVAEVETGPVAGEDLSQTAGETTGEPAVTAFPNQTYLIIAATLIVAVLVSIGLAVMWLQRRRTTEGG